MANKKIQLDLVALRKRKVMVCTPLLGPTVGYFQSMMKLAQLFAAAGMEYVVEPLPNQSDIALARNKMTDVFLMSGCTDMLQVDHDIEFDPWDIMAMLHFDKDVIGANCPRKQIDWNAVREAVILEPSIMPEKLELMGATWMAVMNPEMKEIHLGEVLSVDSVPTGFSITKRTVFEQLAPYRPRFYVDEHHKITDFWSTGPHNERWETEDYAFCRRYREIGGSAWICPWMKIKHAGLHTFVGDMAAVLKHFSEHNRAYALQTA